MADAVALCGLGWPSYGPRAFVAATARGWAARSFALMLGDGGEDMQCEQFASGDPTEANSTAYPSDRDEGDRPGEAGWHRTLQTAMLRSTDSEHGGYLFDHVPRTGTGI